MTAKSMEKSMKGRWEGGALDVDDRDGRPAMPWTFETSMGERNTQVDQARPATSTTRVDADSEVVDVELEVARGGGG